MCFPFFANFLIEFRAYIAIELLNYSFVTDLTSFLQQNIAQYIAFYFVCQKEISVYTLQSPK